MQPSLVVPGSLLAGRYLLVDALERRAGGSRPSRDGRDAAAESHWRARDELLGRPVAVHLIRRSADSAQVLDGARAAARLPVPTVIRVLDVLGAEHLGDAEAETMAGLVVTEWVAGESLETLLLRDGPVPESAVRSLGIVLADTLAAIERARDAELPPPALTPADVVLTEDGGLRVALDRHWGAPPSGPDSSPTLRCGAIGYAALTARWPLSPGESALPTAPKGDADRPRTPRQVRAHVSHPLDDLVSACLGLLGERPATGELRERFRELPDTPAEEPVPPRSRSRWVLPTVAALLLATGFALLVWQVTRAVQRDTGDRSRAVQAAPRATPTPSPEPPPGPLAVASAVGFDPLGDGSEGRGELAVDGDPATAWRTVAYFRRPDLGGLKQGVGLLLDLGQVRSPQSVVLSFSSPGEQVAVFASQDLPDAAPTGPAASGPVRAQAEQTLTLAEGTRARYLLVWLTRLPPAAERGNAYRAEIREARVLGGGT